MDTIYKLSYLLQDKTSYVVRNPCGSKDCDWAPLSAALWSGCEVESMRTWDGSRLDEERERQLHDLRPWRGRPN